MAITFTKQQMRVLNARDHNVLVSAAAGSGKTAVLVERIIRMISEGDHPLDIDRLLVVTFTKAAAAQMRERIGAAIARRIEEDPGNLHLQRQETLLHNAQITTMDSFFTFVLRNNFSEIDLDPGFRQMDQTEAGLLRKDTLEEFLEEGYEKKDPALLLCADYFCRGAGDKEIENMIETLYTQAVSRPDPGEWLRLRSSDYTVMSEEALLLAPWMQYMILTTAEQITGVKSIYARLRALCSLPDGPSAYLPLVREEMEALSALGTVPGAEAAGNLTTDEIRSIREGIRRALTVEFRRLPAVSAKKYPDVDPDKKDTAVFLRNQAKDAVAAIRKRSAAEDTDQILQTMSRMSDIAAALSDLTCRFLERFSEAKREKNVIDFVDLEHFALKILTYKDEEGIYRPRRAALAYRQYFDEILIDEYQDSNDVQELLLRLISTEDEGKFNRFMVGDVKQSIYKFRLARPEIFMQKLAQYRHLDNKTERIDLDSNFRSRAEVLNSVNDVFGRLMRSEIGGVEYSDEVSLKQGASYPPVQDPELYKTELLIVDGGPDPLERELPEEVEVLSARQREALAVAGRIRELAGTLPVTAQDGTIRPCRYGDMVVLLRSGTNWNEDFREVFEKEGIPYYIESKTGYFSAKEIQTVLEMIRVLDNPRQDIPLYGVLKSCFGGFSEEEIACIRVGAPERSSDLYTCLISAAETEICEGADSTGPAALRDKCRHFIRFVNQWRDRVVYLQIYELLTALFAETGYEEWCRALPGGEQRIANLQMLMAQASAFDSMGLQGLFDFVRYIDQIHHRDVDYGEANILDENADVVRIMSIHKSKGLEFPVTIVAGLAKEHSYRSHDTRGTFICDSDWGIGMDSWNPVTRTKYSNIRKDAIADKMKRDSLGEELRVLYVAMTRAKEKLILTGYLPNAAKKCDEWEKSLPVSMERDEKIPVSLIAQSQSFLELILYAVRAGDGSDHIAVRTLNCADLAVKEMIAQSGMALRKQELESMSFSDTEPLPDPETEENLRTIYSRRYASSNLSGLYTKTSVSELKKAFLEEEAGEGAHDMFPETLPSPIIPSFAAVEKAGSDLRGSESDTAEGAGCLPFTGTQYGTAMHRLLELFDYKRFKDPALVTPQEFDKWRDELSASGKIPPEYARMPAAGILRFLKSALAGRMAKADAEGRLFREQPFVLGIRADLINPAFPGEETMLVQGIIDACFLDGDEFVLVDYKTDRVSHAQELRDRYRVQLDLYARALHQITGKAVREKIIYALSLHEMIVL